MNDSDKTTLDIEGKNFFVSWKSNGCVTFVSHFTKYFAILRKKLKIGLTRFIILLSFVSVLATFMEAAEANTKDARRFINLARQFQTAEFLR